MILSEWLESLSCYDVKPCKVTLGNSLYTECCEYKQDHEHGSTWYTVNCIYIIGKRPCPNNHMHYDNHDQYPFWYIGGYFEKGISLPYHPFGNIFLLFPWNSGGSCGLKGITVTMKIEYI